MIIEHLDEQLKELNHEALKQGGRVRITSNDSTIFIELDENELVTSTFVRGTLKKVWRHTVSGSQELSYVFSELGYFVITKIKSCAFWVSKKQDIYFVEVIPNKPEA